MKIIFSARTDVGKVRKINEDNYLIVPEMVKGEKFFEENREYILNNDFSLIMVADGMGGASAGDVAAKIAIDTVYNILKKQTEQGNRNWFEIFHLAFNQVNELLQNYSVKHPEAKGLGTTCICAALYQGCAYISWIGDSRAYLWNESSGLRQLSKDHSLVQDLIDNELITEDQAFDHPNKNVITQSLDDSGSKLNPSDVRVVLKNEDHLFLCSDGLSGMINNKTINSIFYAEKEDQSKLMNTLLQAALDAGGSDNITLVSARFSGVKAATISNSGHKKRIKKPLLLIMGFALLAIGLFIIFTPAGSDRNNIGPDDSITPDKDSIELRNDEFEQHEEDKTLDDEPDGGIIPDRDSDINPEPEVPQDTIDDLGTSSTEPDKIDNGIEELQENGAEIDDEGIGIDKSPADTTASKKVPIKGQETTESPGIPRMDTLHDNQSSIVPPVDTTSIKNQN